MSPRHLLAAAGAATLLLIVPGSPASAQSTPVAGNAGQARLDRARELTRLTHPYDLLLESGLALWEAMVTRALVANPSVVKLEGQYPGIREAAIDAVRPMARRFIETDTSLALEKRAEIYARRLTAAEIEEAIDFFRAPLSQAMLRKYFVSFDSGDIYSELVAQVARTGRIELETEGQKALEKMAGRRATESFSAADLLTLKKFNETSTGKKVSEIRLEADRAILEMSDPDTKFMEEQRQALAAAMAAYVERAKRR